MHPEHSVGKFLRRLCCYEDKHEKISQARFGDSLFGVLLLGLAGVPVSWKFKVRS